MDPSRRNTDIRNFRNAQPFEEPSYRLLPSNENHASSFGAGGSISQVIDPHFRPPTIQNSHIFGQMLDTATMSSNIMSSTLLDYGPPVTVSCFNNLNNTLHFASPPPPPPPPPPPLSEYEDRQNQQRHLQQQQQQHHHQQQQQQQHFHYQQQQHHNPFLPPNARQNTMDSSRGPANQPFRPPYVSGQQQQQQPTIFLPRNNQMPQVITTSAPSMRYNNNLDRGVPPFQTTNQAQQSSFTPSTSQYTRQPNNSSAYMPQQANDGPLYSPKPKNPSPPLDQINVPNVGGPTNTMPSSSSSIVNTNSGLNSRGNFNNRPANSNSNSTVTTSTTIATTTATTSSTISTATTSATATTSSTNPPTATTSTYKTNLAKTNFVSNKPASIGEALGRIPKKNSTVTKASDRFDEMSLLVLQEKYRECESRLEANRLRRQAIEKTLNDMARSSHGKNIELDPLFRQKKDEQRQCDETSQEIRAKMKKISEKLSTKFNHKIVPKSLSKPIQQTSGNRQPPKRAKMSTAAAAPRDSSPANHRDRARLMFKLNDSRVWCKTCDLHLESFAKFCEHLHTRDHLRSMRKSDPPWRKVKDKIDTVKTYNLIKSICSHVSNDVDPDFSIGKLNKLVNPIGTDEKTLKQRFIERERGNFEKDDPLFHIKGFENLIPINGYFCQLCDRSYCDYTAIEQHVKSYEHNHRYAISVANDEATVRTFREQQEKSYRKQHPEKSTTVRDKSLPPSSSSTNKQVSSTTTDAPTSTTSAPKPMASTSNAAPQTQYKKSTSHIVDEHETVVKKFPASVQSERRTIPVAKQKSSSSSSASRSKRILESDNSEDEAAVPRTTAAAAASDRSHTSKSVQEERPKSTSISVKNRMPDIVPIRASRSKPSALKRLRNEKSKAPISKPYINSTDSDSSDTDDCQILDSEQLPLGDPDSPFPELNLTITGNTHMHVLKDKRLAQFCVVKVNRIKIDDYKDMLMDETTLWTRVQHLMLKKEGEQLNSLSKQLRDKHKTRPTYFTVSGGTVPIDLDEGNDDKTKDNSDVDEKPKLSNLINGISSGGGGSDQNVDQVTIESHEDSSKKVGTQKSASSTQKSANSTTTAATTTNDNDDDNDTDTDTDVSDLEIDTSDNGGPNEKFDMGLLENFFCEK